MSVREVVVVGHAALDRIYRIAAFAKRPAKHRALEHIESGGGSAANAAAAIGRLGGRVQLWSRVGRDDNGCKVIAALASDGVETGRILRHEGSRTSTAAVIVDGDGERLVASERDHAMPSSCDWLPLDEIAESAAVVSDMSWREATLAAFRCARMHGVPTVLDIDVGGGLPSKDVLGLTDFAIASRDALETLVDGADRAQKLLRLIALGVRHAGVTLGKEGYDWTNSVGGSGFQPAFEAEVVDTTGAGDAFHGAFAWALARRHNEAECARIAAAVAALKCRRLGARAGLPTREELDVFLVARRA